MNILLTGADGFIGSHIAKELIKQGHTVTPCSRASNCDFSQLTTPKKWLDKLEGIDAIVNSVGIIAEKGTQTFGNLHTDAPIALFEAASQKDIKRIVQISALGADSHALTQYHLSKKAADDALQKTNAEWFILRPSLVYGDGGSSMIFFNRLAALPIIGVPGDGNYLLQPVHVSDLVATVIKALDGDTPSRQIIDVVGSDEITYRDWLQTLRKRQGKSKALILPIPMPLMLAVARVGQYFMPMLRPDNLTMLTKGNTSDTATMTHILKRPPLSIEAGLNKCRL